MFDLTIKSTIDLIKKFSTEESCIKHIEDIRWNGVVVSPFNKDSKVYLYKTGRYKYKCKETGKYFNATTGTMFENTKLDLQKWFLAIWLVVSNKRGISSVQLAKDIDISQKSAWFMLQRIRSAFGIENNNQIGGDGEIVECDESWVGGKNKNRHKHKKAKYNGDNQNKDKALVFGAIQRNGKIVARVVPNRAPETLQSIIYKHVVKGSRIVTDNWAAYWGLNKTYQHDIVKHSDWEYVNEGDNSIHSNSIENSWNSMKRGLSTFVSVSRKYLQKYIDEFVYRFNLRDLQDSDKFNWLLLNCGVRTKYKTLVYGN